MNKRTYLIYKKANFRPNLVKYAVDYSDAEFNKALEDYEKGVRGTTPKGTSDEIWQSVMDKNKNSIDDANRGVQLAARRANGWKPAITGLGGLAGLGVADFVASKIPWLQRKEIKDVYGNPTGKYSDYGFWQTVGNLGLRGAGFLAGGAIPYLAMRLGEGAWDLTGKGINAVSRKIGKK